MPQDENIRTPRELAAAIIRQTAGEESVQSAIQGRFQNEEDLQRLLEDYLYLRQNTFRRLKREASLEAFKNVVRDSLVLAGRDIRIGDDYHIKLDDPAEKRLQNLKIDLLRREIHNYRNFQFPDQTHDYIQLPMQARLAEVRPFSKVEQRRAGPQDVTHMPIQEVFNHFNGEMLILGSPGAGKTTLLYELANSLAAEAKYGMIEQTPVLLNLSSWGSRKEDLPSIFSWVVEELIEAGGKKQWNRLIEGGHLIFLFDGLDEVPENKRVACMQAINAFSRDYRARTAVCCRRAEYDLIRKSSDGQALRLEGAIEIMPIEEEQAMAYFHKHELQRVAEAFSRSDTLRELLRTPLWLYLATRTYSSEKWELLPEGADGWNNVLMGFYEDWLLDEKRPQENQKRASGYAEEDVVQWTAWLAFVLDREKQTVFRLERMQYYFLPKRLIPAYAFYAHLAFGLAFGLAGGLAFGMACGLAVGVAGGLAVVMAA
ncbi:MAG: NACHT domain-containing protein [Phaeodactylibacter sp.]|nr:NACHT domain-containing protein [Phaeodactylibacter sp.]